MASGMDLTRCQFLLPLGQIARSNPNIYPTEYMFTLYTKVYRKISNLTVNRDHSYKKETRDPLYTPADILVSI